MRSRILWNVLPIPLSLAVLLIANCSSSPPNFDPIPLDELKQSRFDYSRRSEYSTRRLINYLRFDYLQWHWANPRPNEEEAVWSVRKVLGERKGDRDIAEMLHAYRTTKDALQRESLSVVLRDIDDPRVTAAFREAMAHTDDLPVEYAALNYLAEKGDPDALEFLLYNPENMRCSSTTGCSSQDWAETVSYFGKHKYKPAVPHLLIWLNSANLGLGGASCQALENIYPGPHPKLGGPRAAYEYFSRLYEKEGGKAPPFD